MNLINVIFFLVFMAMLPSHDALAHNITVFCWFENGTLQGEGYFSNSDPVINSKISVVNPENKRLLAETVTSREGTFSVAVDEQQQIQVILDAGQGHRATWFSETANQENLQPGPGAAPGKASPAAVAAGPVIIAGLFGLLYLWKRRHAT